MLRVYCQIPEVYDGFRNLEKFNEVATSSWSPAGEFFPMYDPDTSEIFECAFNAQEGLIVAYKEISVEEFRARLQKSAEKLISARVQQAIIEASKEASRIYETIEFSSKLWSIRHLK
ncbi:MAG: hypothetical protein E7547_02510 [Ruminococcaceae bacterium]|nr:hypothetical protein [Oscillospiraceae bacterium]